MRSLLVRALTVISLCIFGMSEASAQSTITIQGINEIVKFPESVTFTAHIESSAPIESVVLEYGVDKLTCGKVIGKVFPDFKPGNTADVSWTWDMRKSGSEPPGAVIWSQWHVVDKLDQESGSEVRNAVWLDTQHDWKILEGHHYINVHWYEGSDDFAQQLLDSADSSLAKLSEETGVTPQSQINMYIYANSGDMQDAVFYEPNWTGGLAYPEYDIVIIGISPNKIEWGKRTEAHELTHVLVGHLAFSCLTVIPTWLDEGMAVYGEGGLEDDAKKGLQDAITSDKLISIRALSGGFSEHPAKADLSYSESYSVVNFLIDQYGRDKIVQLFGKLKSGLTIEDALNDVYGFELDGLEDVWRASVGAKPAVKRSPTPGASLSPTPVPTYRIIGVAPLAPTGNATDVPDAKTTSVHTRTAQPIRIPSKTSSKATQADLLEVVVPAVVLFVVLPGIYLLGRREKKG